MSESTAETPPTPDAAPTGAPAPAWRTLDGYRAMFERCPLPMWLYDVASLRILEVNAAAIAKYGYSEAEFLQLTLYDLRPSDLHGELRRYMGARPADGAHALVTRHRLRDGRMIDVEVTGQALGPEFPGVRLTIAQDATQRVEVQRERDRSQARLRDSEARQRELALRLTTTLESITDAFFTIDREGKFTYVNRRTEEALHRSRTDLLGRSGWEIFPNTLGSLIRQEFERAMHDGAAVHFTEYFEPTQRWLEVHAYPSDQGLAVYFRDVTELREAERAHQAKQSAESASRLKTEFMSRLSHEMRTPLNAMLGFAQLMSLQYTTGRRADDKTQLGYANHILQAGRHLLSLVNDVLEVQQMDEGRLAFNLVPVDLAEAARSTMSFLAPLATAHAVSMQLDVPSGIFVMADEVRLRQVMLNLASNAIKYNRRGGNVHWGLRWGLHSGLRPHREGFATLVITDQGPGISAEHQTSLFQPFQRLGKEASAIEGTGLGLVVSRGLVEQMGGSLTIESEPGQGTRAVVELPLQSMQGSAAAALPAPVPAPAVVTAPAVAAEPVAAPGPRPCRLLYVEDNRLNAMLFEAAFGQRPDIELRIAADGQACMQTVAEWLPDLLALDAHLPDTSGLQLLAELRRVPGLADTPAFMCSAAAMPEDIERARDAGFRGYWTKPVDITQILADIRGVGPFGTP